MLTAERLRQALDYSPETGFFCWRERLSCRIRIGDVAGCIASDGYVRIRIDGVSYLGHRLAWLYVQGQWPAEQIDHVNGIKSDNRLRNLRPCSCIENAHNAPCHADNGVGLKGVTIERRTGRFFARICVNRRTIHLGTFSTTKEAAQAYDTAARHLHGEFARTNEAA